MRDLLPKMPSSRPVGRAKSRVPRASHLPHPIKPPLPRSNFFCSGPCSSQNQICLSGIRWRRINDPKKRGHGPVGGQNHLPGLLSFGGVLEKSCWGVLTWRGALREG
ncbi:hypothetical protein BU16DRAFT_119473 [Lophium mytilinum]|uniref:Uncharacterized protein n=1 Tax=Lophium mytilinum TaxID=390894 RepID=A0A6A6QGU6_9PEZI|nr:hypothetical protein BU16DRAFT_119473 [Lophium mytilinum]